MTAPQPDPPGGELPVTAKFWTRESIGDVLDERFEIAAPISTGGTAVVYEAKDRALRCMVAVKVLTLPSEDARRRFLDEGRLLANLRTPHLVQVLAVGEVDRYTPFMALELLPGRSLEDRVRKDGPLPWREAAALLVQVTSAIAFLHQFGVVHRDIKPGNIVQIGSATGRPLVKLIDLGIAKVQDWQRIDTTGFTPSPRHQTELGQAVGTPGFLPPEAGQVPVDPRHDVYGLGATLYALCTGAPPKSVYLLDLPPMSEVCPACKAPPELETLARSALALMPEDRVATVEEFQRRLEAILVAHVDETEPYLFAGCFELIQPLGVGAKGEVYKAYHRDAPCCVALKLLSERARADPDERAHFAREARVLRAVRHPAIPELVECRTSAKQRQPYIAMALAPGRPAGEFCLTTHSLGPADVIAVGRCIASALAALHTRGILHRDVHAPNVLVDVEHQPTTAMLIDFGMAEFEDKFYAVVDQRYPTRPEDRAKLGSGGLERLEWTAPEARAGKGWTGKSDVYSLGLLLYRMLTGKRPTDATGALVSPRKLKPNCPQALASALLTALNPDPESRVDATRFLAMLDAAADELSEDADEVDDSADAATTVTPITTTSPPRPVSTETPRHSPTRVWARAGMVALAVLVLVLMWRNFDRTSLGAIDPAASPPTWSAASESIAATRSSDAKRSESTSVSPEEPPRPSTQPSVPTQVAAVGSLPTMREALDAAAAGLRNCSQLAGGLLMVEFNTAPARDQFAKVAVRGYADATVDRCVQDATALLRFEPEEQMLFTKEYTP